MASEQDHRVAGAFAAVAPAAERFRSAVARTAEEVRGFLSTHHSNDEAPGTGPEEALGRFAVGRIDPARFASLFASMNRIDPEPRHRIEQAMAVLREILARGDDVFRVRVAENGNLCEAVARALADSGRAFGAARVAELSRAGRYDKSEHGDFLQSFPHERWSSAERAVAPPLVVEVPGARLRAGGLAEFLDGAQKLVLVVEGECTPAPLVRLVTPNTLVAQAADPQRLAPLRDWAGCAAAALVSEAQAQFVHDPRDPSGSGLRIELISMPAAAASRSIGGLTAFQQAEELGQLLSLADGVHRSPEGGDAGPGSAAEGAEPADRLADWLLRQAGMSDGA